MTAMHPPAIEMITPMLMPLPDGSDIGMDPLLEPSPFIEPPLPDLELLEGLLPLPVVVEEPPSLVVVVVVSDEEEPPFVSVFPELAADVEVEPTSGVTVPSLLESPVVVSRRASLLLYHFRQLTSQEWVLRVFAFAISVLNHESSLHNG
ncbi:hypothetical protein PI125_g2052 [Phytophthora idaei]|nr:hypothetical protein PI125_g2052 [Phytophthora idaei]